ncbi:putative transcriptional regulator [Bacillus mesophilus]|uniref:CBS domain-containing protein n=1 Tax=Bacillus mesophilus TaxID=1808955 RepID=A0A6M0Q2M8_9BACI|nr:cyclic-di-AMP-binding protein CbpB [Bacillus mesophilus]MBM7659552.1 putative transcriptional regulator [Bacillus mesophilus]NEY70424.1 CBS domain-containing protein [Bacillus mesophilus]
MISLQREEFVEITIKDLIISSDKVAHVQLGNGLEHALLVLVKSGYSAIPVLDPSYHLHGLISTALILDTTLGLERIEFERLETMKVEEVMNNEAPRLNIHDSLEKGLELVINHPFVCVENDDGVFEGILTRRVILKKLNEQLKKLNYKQ